MVTVKLAVTGADGLARGLREVATAVDRPARPLLAAIGEDMGSVFQDFIRTGGARLPQPWPELHPVTVKIREHYGHGGRSPKMIRGGQLLHSIRVLSITDQSVEVGTVHYSARVLQDGGTWTDPETGVQRQVQAFPFVELLDEDVADWTEMIADWFLGRGGTLDA